MDSVAAMKLISLCAALMIWTCQVLQWNIFNSNWNKSLCLCQVSCDWTGSGRLQCYGVVDTDVSTPAGGGYLERGQLRCTLEEWVYETGRGPEAMFFKPTTGGEFEVWAVSISRMLLHNRFSVFKRKFQINIRQISYNFVAPAFMKDMR